ncbi:hypothetical protein [Prauserella muralis]|uniref:Uncharacterized protein n=1 Tax=Prauserella muralis TaxID=588067 RepID=A0A2V4ALH5_9PSEU|nr:hypothetical protein [Prauserella muralis]PXY21148.1 hypothetical protein BAY60_27155 [Prauserella muralis]TWE30236.1 hypothetical protein FHX69_2933 [Prauserella muralis]
MRLTRQGIKEGGALAVGGVALAAVALIVAAAIAAMAIFGWGWFKRSTAEFRGTTEQRERTVADPDYRITAYDRFFDLCAAVQSKEATLAALQDELGTEPPTTRVTQIRANLTAVTAARAADINQYNADAEKAGTAGQFRASNLPYRLDINDKETQCTA